MKRFLLAGLAGLALMAAVPANAQGFYAGVGPLGVYVGPGYDADYYGPDWRYRHYHRTAGTTMTGAGGIIGIGTTSQ